MFAVTKEGKIYAEERKKRVGDYRCYKKIPFFFLDAFNILIKGSRELFILIVNIDFILFGEHFFSYLLILEKFTLN
jgi:hypothetical protein